MIHYGRGKARYHPMSPHKQRAWWIILGLMTFGGFSEERALQFLVGIPNPRNGLTPATEADVRWFLGHCVRHNRLERYL